MGGGGQQFRRLADTIPHDVFETDTSGVITFANRDAEGALRGTSILDLTATPQERARLEQCLASVVAERPEAVPWYGTARDRSGRLRAVRADWAYRTDAAGKIEGLLVILTEVAEHPGAGRETSELLEAIVESSADAIYMKDRDGVYRLTNSAGSALVGRTPPQVLGRTDRAFFPAEVADGIQADDLRVMENGEVLHSEDHIDTPQGTRVLFSVKSPYRDAEGRVVGLVGVSRDITDRKRAEEELQQARDRLEERVRERTAELEAAKQALERDIEARERAEQENRQLEARLRQSQTLEAVGRLAGGVAHDFNNLLGGILACAWTARVPDSTPEQIRAELYRIQDLCKRGGEVTRQLLALARQTPTKATPLDLGEELDRLRGLVERTCPKPITVVFDLANDLPRVAADRALLTTALLNLCLNARDAMPAGGTLTVRARPGQDSGGAWAVIAVSDTGGGIPPELHDRVFQPFFSTKVEGRGVGLGLAMVSATAKDMGGTLDLESAPGHGSTFTLRLPVLDRRCQVQEPAPAGPAETEPRGPAAGAILVVDDEDDIARMVASVLSQHGYEAVRARDGIEALEIVRERVNDLALILLDLMLPELSGASIHRVLAATAPHIPVVFVTGWEELALESDPRIPLLRKPFTAEELLDRVNAAVAT